MKKGRFVEASKVNLVKATVFAYNKGHSMYVIKNLGKAGIVPIDILQAIDELLEEGRLEKRKTRRATRKKKPFGGIQFVHTKIEELMVSAETQAYIQSIFKELCLPLNLLERNGFWVNYELTKVKEHKGPRKTLL